MISLNIIHPDGRAQTIAADHNESVMQAASRQGIEGIVAECGGNAMCATCHVYVAEDWLSRLPPMRDDEDALLEGAAAERRANSRLSCQLPATAEIDGLVLQVPERQV